MKLIKSDKIENTVCEDVKENEVKDILENQVPEIIDLIKSLNKKLKVRNGCYGLSAIQVGMFKKYFIRYYGNVKGEDIYDIYFNAWYINNNSSRFQSREGCMSYDLGKKVAIVKRWKKIIMFHDEWNYKENKFKRKQKKKLYGVDAIVVQHECDHQKGITIFTKGKEK
jgi:peptide deformylase